MLSKFFLAHKLEFTVTGHVQYLIMIKNSPHYSKHCTGPGTPSSPPVAVWWIHLSFSPVNKHSMVIKHCTLSNKASILPLSNLLHENIIERWKIHYVCRRRVITSPTSSSVVLREASSSMWLFVSASCNFLMVSPCFCTSPSFSWCLAFSLPISLFSFWIVSSRTTTCNCNGQWKYVLFKKM